MSVSGVLVGDGSGVGVNGITIGTGVGDGGGCGVAVGSGVAVGNTIGVAVGCGVGDAPGVGDAGNEVAKLDQEKLPIKGRRFRTNLRRNAIGGVGWRALWGVEQSLNSVAVEWSLSPAVRCHRPFDSGNRQTYLGVWRKRQSEDWQQR